MDIEERLKDLQGKLATIDLLTEPRSTLSYTEFLVVKLQNIKPQMYQEKGHSTPHLHIDYGKQIHAASYAIHDGSRLAGNLSKKYDREVTSWINANRKDLKRLWHETQNGRDVEVILAKIRVNT